MPFAFWNVTVPEVYVALETAKPEMPVCAPPALAPLIVTELPFWLSVTLLPPAKNSVPVLTSASAPDVFPPSVTPPPPPPPTPPTMEIVAEPPFVDPDSVMFAPPASTNWFDASPVLPAVLPPVLKPADSKVSPVVPGAEMMNVLLDKPPEITPASDRFRELFGYVLELDWPVVLPAA